MKAIKITVVTLLTLVTALCVAAQMNYLAAMKAARASERTDAAIEAAMYAHGFRVDAMDTAPTTGSQKITALFTINP
jgi:hypothetical protein